MELVNEWFPTGKFINVDTSFRTDYIYKKELMDALPLKGNALHKVEMENNGKFGHTIGRIQQIDLMIIIEICYAIYNLATQILAPNLTGSQGIKRCVQYMYSHPNKPIFHPSNYYNGPNVIRLTCSGN